MNELQMSADEMEAKFGPEDPTPAPAPEVAENKAEVVASAPDKELGIATSALERDGWSKADIAALSADRIKVIGAKRHENQEKVSSDYRDYYALKDAQKSGAGKAAEASSDSGQAPLVDISAQMKSFEEEFGPEAAKALEGVLGPLAKTVEGLRQQSETIRHAEVARERTRLQGVAAGVLPEAANELVAKGIFVTAQSLIDADPTLSEEDAVRKAAGMFRQPAPPARSENLGNVAQAQPRAAPVRQVTKHEREMMVLEAIERGVPREDLRKIMQG